MNCLFPVFCSFELNLEKSCSSVFTKFLNDETNWLRREVLKGYLANAFILIPQSKIEDVCISRKILNFMEHISVDVCLKMACYHIFVTFRKSQLLVDEFATQ